VGTAFAPAPLLLEPVPVVRAWGGLALLRDYQPTAPEGARIGESWDIACHPGADCRMLTGPLAGAPLSQLLARHGEAVLGRPWRDFNDFPLLHKYLGPLHDLPLQVHPDDDYALRVEGCNGKAECWVVLDCAPGASVLLGLDGVVSGGHLRDLVAAGELARHARRVPVKYGDVVPIPAGTVHSLGAGVLAYEVQQNSDVTYRIDDFGLGIDSPDARRVHLARALDVIDLPANLAAPHRFDNWADGEGVLDFAPRFGLAAMRVAEGQERLLPGTGRCRGLAVLDGRGLLAGSEGVHELRRGQGWLLPAAGGPLRVAGELRLLLSTFPGSPSRARYGTTAPGRSADRTAAREPAA
jgi:mannose-6-phosphate isomerase